MDRRTFLATAAAGGAAATTGCGGLVGSPVDLRAREPQVNHGGRTKVVAFEHDGQERASLALRQESAQDSPVDAFDLRFVVHHFPKSHENSVAQRYRVDVRAPPRGGVLFNPGSLTDWPVTMERIGDSWTRISAELGGERGDSNVDLPLRIDPLGEPIEAVQFRTEVDIADSGFLGRTYRIGYETRFDPVVEE